MQLLLSKGAMLPGVATPAQIEVVRRVNKDAVARSLVPSLANEAVVGLALEVGRKRQREEGEEGEGALES